MFIPPHCPNPLCSHFEPRNCADWYQKRGSYRTITFKRVPRFRCKSCKKDFSRQTFSIDYFAKRTLDYQFIYRQINAGAGIRNIARDLNVKAQAITNRINRMARNATIANQIIVDHLPFSEDLVLDGLQNFCVSQYFPDNYTILVGKDSQFVYDCDYATLRRAGRMTERQKIKRAFLERQYRAPGKSVEQSFLRLLSMIDQKKKSYEVPLILYTDDKSDYQRAFWNHKQNREKMFCGQWRHHQTNSKIGRNTKNPLFSVNYIDREIRKDMASQARETVQYPRNVSNAMLRMNLYLFDHNVRKPYRVRTPRRDQKKHVDVAGIGQLDSDLLLNRILTSRLFKPKDLKLSSSSEITLKRGWVTPLKRSDELLPIYMVV